MWLSRCTSSQFKLSSEELVLNDEDLLTLILLRVPYRKLKTFKCVSKKWLYLITTPRFSRVRCNLLPPVRASGLFIQRPPIALFCQPCPNEVYFVPLDDLNTRNPYETAAFANDPFDPERIRILGSCNGLLLCSTCLLAFRDVITTYVYNPSTNKLDILPKHPPANGVEYLSLAFDPLKSPHYKVIAYVTTSQADSIGDFHVYSSETGTWSLSVQSFYLALDMCLEPGVYWHGCIYWLGDLNIQPVLGSTASDGLYLNVDEGRLGTFPRPPINGKLTSRSSYFGESEDHLHFIGVCPNATSVGVYELKSDYSEWFIKYWIDLAPISKVFPEMTKHKACYVDGNTYAFAVLSLIRRENFQEDSFLVLEIPGKVIRYNLVDASFKAIWDFAVDFGVEKVDIWRFGRFKVWQYIEALSCV
ncbi:putative F-box domain-containing protein [Heracleum sosnowskyi]|uniref:F-box domain-containing protein n=1 Tax=Heracleum sosnowskyi TaxID=360622 RepID=A0AAD8LWY2_9APIA|nr:putative F-box domain-containing protein [Heracleum sosnowskyi]